MPRAGMLYRRNGSKLRDSGRISECLVVIHFDLLDTFGLVITHDSTYINRNRVLTRLVCNSNSNLFRDGKVNFEFTCIQG